MENLGYGYKNVFALGPMCSDSCPAERWNEQAKTLTQIYGHVNMYMETYF